MRHLETLSAFRPRCLQLDWLLPLLAASVCGTGASQCGRCCCCSSASCPGTTAIGPLQAAVSWFGCKGRHQLQCSRLGGHPRGGADLALLLARAAVVASAASGTHPTRTPHRLVLGAARAAAVCRLLRRVSVRLLAAGAQHEPSWQHAQHRAGACVAQRGVLLSGHCACTCAAWVDGVAASLTSLPC
jgi:hypothetical protein